MILYMDREEMHSILDLIKKNETGREMCGFFFTYGSNIKDVMFAKNKSEEPNSFKLGRFDILKMKAFKLLYTFTMAIPFHTHRNGCELSARDTLDLPQGLNCIISGDQYSFFNLRRNRNIVYRDEIPCQLVDS